MTGRQPHDLVFGPYGVEWFNNRRLLAPIGNVPPTECEQQYYLAQKAPVMTAGVN